jgi:hypothetical protein
MEISGDDNRTAVSGGFFAFLFFRLAFNYSSTRIIADVRRIVDRRTHSSATENRSHPPWTNASGA